MTRFEKIQGLIQKAGKGKVAVEKIVPAADLRSDLGLDSLAMMELLVLTEEAFDLKISKEDAVATKTVGQMSAYIDSHVTA